MKIINTDNFDRESKADTLVCSNITNKTFGVAMTQALNFHYSGDSSPNYFRLVEDDFRLSKGMEDIVG